MTNTDTDTFVRNLIIEAIIDTEVATSDQARDQIMRHDPDVHMPAYDPNGSAQNFEDLAFIAESILDNFGTDDVMRLITDDDGVHLGYGDEVEAIINDDRTIIETAITAALYVRLDGR